MNNLNSVIERERLRTEIMKISSSKFYEKCFNIVAAERNVYGIPMEVLRLKNTFDLILMGTEEKAIIAALERHTEWILVCLGNIYNKINNKE